MQIKCKKTEFYNIV